MKYIFTLIISLLSSCVQADDWTTEQKSIGVVALTATAIDWTQTNWIVDHDRSCSRQLVQRPGTCTMYRETNPIIGRPLSKTKAALYFGLGGVAEGLIANTLPGGYRTALLTGIASFEVYRVGRNYNIGMGMSF